MSEELRQEMQDWISYHDAHPDRPYTYRWGMAILHNIAIELHIEDGN